MIRGHGDDTVGVVPRGRDRMATAHAIADGADVGLLHAWVRREIREQSLRVRAHVREARARQVLRHPRLAKCRIDEESWDVIGLAATESIEEVGQEHDVAMRCEPRCHLEERRTQSRPVHVHDHGGPLPFAVGLVDVGRAASVAGLDRDLVLRHRGRVYDDAQRACVMIA